MIFWGALLKKETELANRFWVARNSKKKNSFFYKCAADQITNLTLTSFNSSVINNYSVRTSS